MKEFAFINVPVFELWNPSAALAALTPMIKRNGYQPRLVDINLELYEVLSDQDWDELQDWSAFVRDHISSDLEQKFLSVVDQHLKNINCDWLAISVFSYYSA